MDGWRKLGFFVGMVLVLSLWSSAKAHALCSYPYIDDANADIRELQSHNHRLRGIAEGYLRKELAIDGLSIRNFVMDQKSLVLSQALQMKTNFASHQTISGISLDQHAFDQKMNVQHSAVDVQTALELDSLNLKAELRKDENDAVREELRNRQEDW